MPNVPSEPINRFVKLYPADVFLVLLPVLIISPLGKTTVRPEITVFIVPYFTAIVPEAEVEAILIQEDMGIGDEGGGKTMPEIVVETEGTILLIIVMIEGAEEEGEGTGQQDAAIVPLEVMVIIAATIETTHKDNVIIEDKQMRRSKMWSVKIAIHIF